MTKKCFKCQIVKPLTEFYKHSAMKDGYLNKCKDCSKADSKNHRKYNLEKYREYDRNRPNKLERYQIQYEYNKTDKGRQVKKAADQKYREGNRIKQRARDKTYKAIARGALVSPKTCSCCGFEGRIEAHHDDYEKPLEVRWLCVNCHSSFHKKVREFERSLGFDLENNIGAIRQVASWYWNIEITD